MFKFDLSICVFVTFYANYVLARYEKCLDQDMNCYQWVADEPERCSTDEIVVKECKKTCVACPNQTVVPDEYNLKMVPENLKRVAFLVGRWRSEFGGKADLAFAWDNSDLTELHSENGYLTGQDNSSIVALTTVMSNGFNAVEEGEEKDYSIRFILQRIGRINFSRDLPVQRMFREWVLLNQTHLESRLVMGTSTHPLMLHTHIIYKKIYP